MNEVQESVKQAIKQVFHQDVEPEISRPDEKFGDFATNVALQLAQKMEKAPREIAQALATGLSEQGKFESVSVEGPGFINIRLKDDDLIKRLESATDTPKPLAGQEILVEFGDPNPFKQMHIGHLYSYIVGEGICRLLESAGASVKRLSYHGDVGLHVAKAIYGLLNIDSDGQDSTGTQTIDREHFLGAAYAYGADKYESDPKAKDEIEAINLHVYKKDDPKINDLYEKGAGLSFEYFQNILELLNIKNDKRYLESQTVKIGEELVNENIGKVFSRSEGAVIFEGEKVGLHTRVFITSKGLPTYETKDLGLTDLKNSDFPNAARSIIITASEQNDYFKVMLAALAEINKPLAEKTTHISHGFLSLSTGKMSSRTGEVYSAMDLLQKVKSVVHELYPESNVRKEVTFSAVKYAFLKHKIGPDIIYDVDESVSLEGNSGPYLQYAYARAFSILQKAGGEGQITDFKSSERSLALKISEYPDIVARAASELMPQHVANYLYELAQKFNSFYEHNRVIGDERQPERLVLVAKYADVLKEGLDLLGIDAPERV
jgi:arginyl-tRNA synthetase